MWICPKCKKEFDTEPAHHTCSSEDPPIAAYIHAQREDMQPRLWEVYQVIKTALPDAREKISYQMPTFWQGRNLIHFGAFSQWIGLFPGGEATHVFAERLSGYHTSKGGIRLMNNRPLPLELIADIAVWCKKNEKS